MMKVRVLMFAVARQIAGREVLEVELPALGASKRSSGPRSVVALDAVRRGAGVRRG